MRETGNRRPQSTAEASASAAWMESSWLASAPMVLGRDNRASWKNRGRATSEMIPRRQRLAGGPGQIMGNAHPWPLPGHAANGGESNAELDDAELIRNIKLRVRASRQLPPSQDPMQDERLLHPGPRLTPLGLSSAD